MLLRSYSENRNKKFQIQGGGLRPSLNLSGVGECPTAPPVSAPDLLGFKVGVKKFLLEKYSDFNCEKLYCCSCSNT